MCITVLLRCYDKIKRTTLTLNLFPFVMSVTGLDSIISSPCVHCFALATSQRAPGVNSQSIFATRWRMLRVIRFSVSSSTLCWFHSEEASKCIAPLGHLSGHCILSLLLHPSRNLSLSQLAPYQCVWLAARRRAGGRLRGWKVAKCSISQRRLLLYSRDIIHHQNVSSAASRKQAACLFYKK